MFNIAPAIAGDADQPSLWPNLCEKAFGQNLLQRDTEEGGWAFFFRTGSPYATELQSEIERLKGLCSQASQDASQEQDPGKAIFEAPTNSFGIGVSKVHNKFFGVCLVRYLLVMVE